MKAIEITNLVKTFTKVHAVKGISFSIKEGEFFGFLGPNGAGKTTTINILTGLADYDSGKVTVFGYDTVKDYRNARKMIGLSPQEFNFDPFMTTREVLMYAGGYFGMTRKEAMKRANELLRYFDLSSKAKSNVKKLSGGMKRRLSIARALMHRPKLLILDEPTAGVDVELRRTLWKFLKTINKDGTTILLTTHYLEEAEKLCDRICILNHGEIIALDTKEKMINKLGTGFITMTIEKSIKKLPSEFKQFKYTISEGIITFQESGEKIPKIMKLLAKNKINVLSVNQESDNLEEIFIRLTGK